MNYLRSIFWGLLVAALCLGFAPSAWAFCGFYVAKADTSLYNQASQVIIARNGDRTVLTMANDYQGEVADFAMVVPVPTVLQEEQVHVGDPAIVEHLDAFSAPRLVEYFDPDPCTPVAQYAPLPSNLALSGRAEAEVLAEDALGVTVESSFTVGEYDIVILSARESDGLETWLRQNDYQIPAGASELLRPYIRQGMKFFVAKVNLEEFDRGGFQALRPLQMAYESPRFMLPIRLGMINAQAAQDLVVYLITPDGQAELTNYRTVNVPSNAEIPLFVKEEFSDFYKAMFQTAYEREGRNVAFLEYAWNLAGCDPCAAEPLTPEELRQAGVFWLTQVNTGFRPAPTSNALSNAFVTRLHVRYTRDQFPEDLAFQATSNQQFFQGRYVLRHPYTGEMNCSAGEDYQRSLPERFEQEAQTLANLTGWDISDIRTKLPATVANPIPWWRRLWR
ncbi:MAG: DUF2330 domain-containing protein [Leptolyngbyaceae cyanobacterium SL_1_1]|nr:DUF2330 domain-containing protein [Leptolyngbyaceae cyanobacterium RM2_2_21]NJN04003.1 DUF2330 domain-containing protein [Leptolyngbyaceae cyanobacterium RM1_1_2]NJO11001.1 DUF2330 domain-containing protein [Leptolyngbyaceae cyanobacterium SL_1_1]